MALLGAIGAPGCDLSPTRPALTSSGPAALDLGTVRPGARAEGTLRLVNSTAEAWRVARVESSCPCVTVMPTAFAVDPGGSMALAVTCNLADEPDFRGGLAVMLVGTATDGAVLATAQVGLTVLDR